MEAACFVNHHALSYTGLNFSITLSHRCLGEVYSDPLVGSELASEPHFKLFSGFARTENRNILPPASTSSAENLITT
jgi:hypothetical protein